MHICVFAANGKSGRAFVMAALEAGHTVTAAVHGYNPFDEHEKLKVVTCDVQNEHQVASALVGAEAVTSFIGHTKNSTDRVQSIGISMIIEQMQKAGLKRLISLTGTGVRFPGDKISLLDRILNLSIQIIDPKRISDGKNHVAIIKESTLDWTVIRVLKLTRSTKVKGTLTLHGPARLFVSRATVASVSVQAIEQGLFIGQSPIVS
jgi:putative NADH-flavin reductase